MATNNDEEILVTLTTEGMQNLLCARNNAVSIQRWVWERVGCRQHSEKKLM